MNQQINNEIRLRLTGDDGGVRQKCPCCSGDGLPSCENDDCGFSGRSKRVSLEDGSAVCESCGWRCPDCTNGWIENKVRIAKAVGEFAKPHGLTSFNTQCYEDGLRHGALAEATDTQVWCWLWDNREGQPWQSALEAFVLGEVCPNDECGTLDGRIWCKSCNGTGRIGGYIEPAPDYDTPEGMVLLKEALIVHFGPHATDTIISLEYFSDRVDAGVMDIEHPDSHYGGTASVDHTALFLATCAAPGITVEEES